MKHTDPYTCTTCAGYAKTHNHGRGCHTCAGTGVIVPPVTGPRPAPALPRTPGAHTGLFGR